MQRWLAILMVSPGLLFTSCKTPTVNKRGQHTLEEVPGSGDQGKTNGNQEQPSAGEIKPVPPVPAAPNNSGDTTVMIPEVGVECKVPVMASCLKIPYRQMTTTEMEISPAVIRKYSRAITAAEHKCPFFEETLKTLKNIAYFPDALIYWNEKDDKSINYKGVEVNFVFAAGCEVGGGIQNPYATELKATATWDGKSLLKDLGYKFDGVQVPPTQHDASKRKGEKVTLDSLGCPIDSRPLVYLFPDGAIFSFVDAGQINIRAMSELVAAKCKTPDTMKTAIEANAPKCSGSRSTADTLLKKTLKDIGLDPAVNGQRFLTQERIDGIELHGKPITKEMLGNCTWAVRPNIYLFADGLAFLDANCLDANIYTTERAKTNGCTIPPIFLQR